MAQPKVLYIIQNHEFSGAELMHAPLMKDDPDALLACPPGSATERLARELGVATVPLPYRPLRVSAGAVQTLRSAGAGALTARDLRRLIRHHPERRVIFCTSIRPGLVASLASAGLDRRLVWCLPDFLPPWPLRGVTRVLARATAARALGLSQAIADDFAGGSGRLRTMVRVVYPGVEPSRFDGPAVDPGAPLGAIVGHVSPTKRTEFAVEVAGRVTDRVPGFRLRVVGRAQFREEDFALERRLRRDVASMPRLRAAVEFHGYATDVRAALAGCGFLFHARPDEPFGIALIEAMAMGLPVVAPAAAGPLEIVEHGRTGLLYRPLDAASAADAVVELLADRSRAAALGKAARAAVAERFSLARQLSETRALIAEAAA